MNLPNQLTLGRLALTGVFLAVVSLPIPFRWTFGLLLFVLASITDYLDGKIAREQNLITNFGKLMDPLADKVLMAAAFVVLVGEGNLPAWAVVLILAREFLVTGFRLVASAAGSVLPADKGGKWKTTVQIILVIYWLLWKATGESLLAFFRPVYEIAVLSPAWLGALLLWVTVLLTLSSGLHYVKGGRTLLKDA